MKCSICGKENEKESAYCEYCGSKLVNYEKKQETTKKLKLPYVLFGGFLLLALIVSVCLAVGNVSEKNYSETIAKADKFVEGKKYEKAEEVYLEAINIDPKLEEPYIKLSDMYVEQNKKEEAVKILNKAEKEVTSKDGKEKVTKKKEEISGLVNYSWFVNPTIEADDIFYVQLDNSSATGAVNEQNKQFSSSYAAIKKDDAFSLIDTSGNLLDDYLYKNILSYNGSTYVLYRKEPKYEEKWKADCDLYWLASNGIEAPGGIGSQASVLFHYNGKLNQSIDYWTRFVNPPSTAFPIQQGDDKSYVFSTEKKYAIYNADKLVTDFEYDECGSASDGLLAVKQNGKWGYVNEEGKTVIPVSYDASWKRYTQNQNSDSIQENEYAYAASDGYINLVKDEKWELRDVNGKLIIAPGIFEKILPVLDGKCWVKKDGKWGVIALEDQRKSMVHVTEGDEVTLQGKVYKKEFDHPNGTALNNIVLKLNNPIHVTLSSGEKLEGYSEIILFRENAQDVESLVGKDVTIKGKLQKSPLTAYYSCQCMLIEYTVLNSEIAVGDFQNHRYKIYDIESITSWNEANMYCQKKGGHLATITSKEEDDYLYQLLQNSNRMNAYFGLSDAEKEGTWKWITGEAVDYLNWATGEPNAENDKEDYAMYYFKNTDGKWNDGDFDQGGTDQGGKTFICEWDAGVKDV